MLKYLKNKNGWAMALVLIIIIIVPILGTTLYMYSSSALKYADKYKEREQARYLARSGAEAVMKIWKETIEDGEEFIFTTISTVYYHADGSFTLEKENAIGTIDVRITQGDVEDSYRITATGRINDTTQTFSVITSAIATGSGLDSSWYVVDYQTNPLEFSTGNISTTMRILGTSYSATKFETEGIVTVSRPLVSGTDYGFTVDKDYRLELEADGIFFNNLIDLFDETDKVSTTKTALKVIGQNIVFDQDVEIGGVYSKNGSVKQYSTLILEATNDHAITIDGLSGKYTMAYLNEGITIIKLTQKGNSGYYKKDEREIPAGSYYVKVVTDGVDLVQWVYSQNSDFIAMEAGDENIEAPTELFVAEFIYE